MYSHSLRLATLALPPDIARWVDRALRSGWYRIKAGTYQDPDGSLCPIAAAATMAGIWSDHRIAPGNRLWGDPECPSFAVEDFAAYFDLCADELGIDRTVELVCGTLGARPGEEAAAFSRRTSGP